MPPSLSRVLGALRRAICPHRSPLGVSTVGDLRLEPALSGTSIVVKACSICGHEWKWKRMAEEVIYGGH